MNATRGLFIDDLKMCRRCIYNVEQHFFKLSLVLLSCSLAFIDCILNCVLIGKSFQTTGLVVTLVPRRKLCKANFT